MMSGVAITTQKLNFVFILIAFTSLHWYTDPASVGPILDGAVAADWAYACSAPL